MSARRFATSRSALVTGAAGFVGQWLCRLLVREGWNVSGTTLGGPPQTTQILSTEERAAVSWIRGDLQDVATVATAVDGARPDAVFHLAGVSSIAAAGNDPRAAFAVNAGIAVDLLHVLGERRAAGQLDPVVIMVGSAQQYGQHAPAEIPLDERTTCVPDTFYGASKLAQEVMALEAFRADGARVICTRSFNHSGRGQSSQLLIPALVIRALALRGEAGANLELGHQHPVRDFMHVEDVAAAYLALAERGTSGEVYNVCSGEGVSVGDLAQEILRACGVSATLSSVVPFERKADAPALIGRNDKLRATGWRPRRSRADIIQDFLHAATH